MMEKVLDLIDRIKSRREEKELLEHRRRIAAIQKVTQCALCHYRCARCGLPVNRADSPDDSRLSPSGHALCESCGSEFEDFLSVSGRKRPSDLFWQNKEWERMWSAWLDYQKALADFMNSPEFKWLTENPDNRS